MFKEFDAILPSIALLLSVWFVLGCMITYIRYQIKKENETVNISDKERTEFIDEIEKLAVYVSRLPRSKDIIIEYRNKENENDD
ncbi:MAG: hypothetical protein ACK4IX_03425 [Candidatus Sericytochromatia bacterium]